MDTIALSDKIKDLDAMQLQSLLKELKLYQNLSTQLWKRGQDLFHRNKEWKKLFQVEYFTALWEDSAREEAQVVFKKVFWETLDKQSVTFIENSNLGWGMKVYMDDSMVDLSFSKIEKIIKK